MPWVKVDDHMDDHPKMSHLSDAAIGGWLRCLTWCSRNLTDGFLPAATFPTRVRNDEARAELLAAGLIVKARKGYKVHDYLDFQPSKAKVLADREAARVRMGFVRRSRDVRANFGECSGDVRTLPVPGTDPSDQVPPQPPARGGRRSRRVAPWVTTGQPAVGATPRKWTPSAATVQQIAAVTGRPAREVAADLVAHVDAGGDPATVVAQAMERAS